MLAELDDRGRPARQAARRAPDRDAAEGHLVREQRGVVRIAAGEREPCDAPAASTSASASAAGPRRPANARPADSTIVAGSLAHTGVTTAAAYPATTTARRETGERSACTSGPRWT